MELTWTIPFYLGPILLLFAAAAGLWIRRRYFETEPAPAPGRRRLLTALRMGAILLLLWALAGPGLLRSGQRISLPRP